MSWNETPSEQTYMALMWALANPGQMIMLPKLEPDAFVVLGDALVDFAADFYTANRRLQRWLTAMGLREKAPAETRYHFYPTLRAHDLPTLHTMPAPIGPEWPLTFVGCPFDDTVSMHLYRPDLHTSLVLPVGGVPPALWVLRSQRLAVAPWWDVVLVGHDRLAAVPHTASIELALCR